MSTSETPQTLTEKGKEAFEAGQYEEAVQAFQSAAQAYAALHDEPRAAELKNNLSVSLLKMGKAQQALEAVLGTDEVFQRAGDPERQGMALGNQAAALEALKRYDEALAAYERSAQLLAEAGAGDLRALVLRSMAAIKLKRGRLNEAAFTMLGALEAKQRLSLFDRLLRFILRLGQR